MATKLDLYNNALIIVGERILGSLAEKRKPRRLLDQVWDSNNGFIHRMLELSDWNHAINTIESRNDPSVEPDFGRVYGHQKPNDWVRTIEVSLDDYFNMPYLSFVDENNFWWTDADVMYVRYTSSDSLYGGDMSLWPESLANYAEHELARRINKSVTHSNISQKDLEKATLTARNKAASIDAQNEPTKFPPLGTWSRSRFGNSQRHQPRISRV